MSDPNPITRDGAARSARHELAKSIYHRDSDPLPVRIIRAVGHFIDHLLNVTFNHAPGGGLGALIVVALIVGAIALVIWRLGPPVRNTSSPLLLADGLAVMAADHRWRSIRAADDGDWRIAVVERMRAIARELEERGVLDPRPGRTASEFATEGATRLPAVASALADAARTFNAVAYGGVAADAHDLAVVISADNAVASSSGRLVAVGPGEVGASPGPTGWRT